MYEMLSIYKWTLIAGLITAPALALLGIQLATRDRSMQTLCVGQGAMVGVLCGIGFLHDYEGTWWGAMGPFFTAIILSAITFLVTDRLVVWKNASKNTVFAFIFALLLASGYLVSSIFPALESHMAQVYFGDLATLTIRDSQISIVASAICIIVLVASQRVVSNQSFELGVFGFTLESSPGGTWGLTVFKVVSLIMLCLSVQFVGFLFTIAMLFLPTALMGFTAARGLTLHTTLCTIISIVGTLVGFLLSLKYTRLPTVPAIVAVMFGVSLIFLAFDRVFYAFRKVRGFSPSAMPAPVAE